MSYGVDVGYSDHTREPSVHIDAIINCSVIEKHYNPQELKDTPDAGHSLSRLEFRTMVSHIRHDALKDLTPYTENPAQRVLTEKGWFRP